VHAATGVCGLKLLVYGATGVWGLKLLVYATDDLLRSEAQNCLKVSYTTS
jgi:hypothetical protein